MKSYLLALVALLVASVATAQTVEAKTEYLGTNDCRAWYNPAQFQVLPNPPSQDPAPPIIGSILGIVYYVPYGFGGTAYLVGGDEVNPATTYAGCDLWSTADIILPLDYSSGPAIYLLVPNTTAILGVEIVLQVHLYETGAYEDTSRGVKFTVGDY